MNKTNTQDKLTNPRYEVYQKYFERAFTPGKEAAPEEIRFNVISCSKKEAFEEFVTKKGRYGGRVKVPDSVSECGYLLLHLSPDAFIKPYCNYHYRNSRYIKLKENYGYTLGFAKDHERTVKVMKNGEWIVGRMTVSHIRDLNAQANKESSFG